MPSIGDEDDLPPPAKPPPPRPGPPPPRPAPPPARPAAPPAEKPDRPPPAKPAAPPPARPAPPPARPAPPPSRPAPPSVPPPPTSAPAEKPEEPEDKAGFSDIFSASGPIVDSDMPISVSSGSLVNAAETPNAEQKPLKQAMSSSSSSSSLAYPEGYDPVKESSRSVFNPLQIQHTDAKIIILDQKRNFVSVC